MKRLVVVLVLGCAGLMLSPASASAQFGRPFGARPFGVGPGPVIVPSFNPFAYVPRYQAAVGYRINTPPNLFGGTSLGYGYRYAGVNSLRATYYMNYYTVPPYSQGGSYMTGMPTVRPDLPLIEQRTIANAQREAGLPGARDTITGQWDYEKGAPVPGAGVLAPLPNPARGAAAPDRALIASGEALNKVLGEIIQAEASGAKGQSGYIPPLLWEDIRFGGSPAGDLLTLSRQAPRLDFPAAFDNPSLAKARDELEKDFAAVAAAVLDGKSPEAAKVTKLDLSYRRLRDGTGPVIGNLPFEDATAARRFLNQIAGAIKALKAGSANGFVEPRWATEGLTVADLTRYMGRHNIQFAPAPLGSGEAYTTMYQNLATYLAVLTQSKK